MNEITEGLDPAQLKAVSDFIAKLKRQPTDQALPLPVLEVPQRHCLRCGHDWAARVSQIRACPKCKSPYWNKARVRGVKPVTAPIVLAKIP